MPLIDERQYPQDIANIAGQEQVPDPNLAETFKAAFRIENVVGSYFSSQGIPNPRRVEDGFNVIDYIKDDPEFSPHLEEFAGYFNREAADALKLQIRQEQQDRRTIAAAGGMGFVASMAAGVIDLPTLLPVGGGIIGAGTSALRTMAGAAIGAGIDAAVSETGLHLTQVTRTGEETMYNIGGSILLGGALGTLAGRYLSSAEAGAVARKIENSEREFDAVDSAFINAGRATSAGAAARDSGPLTLKDEGIIASLPGVRAQDPMIRLQLSPFSSARESVRRMAETPLEYADNARGVATELGGSVETRIKMWNAPLASSMREIDTFYARYFHSTHDPSSWQRRLSPAMSEFDRRFRGGQRLTAKEFREEVGRAAYSGEVHAIPEVAEAARVYRRFDEALKRAAIDARLFPEDVKVVGDVSHRFRVYNREKIIARRGEFAERLLDYFKSTRDIASRADVENAVDAAAKKAARETEDFSRLTDAELKSIVDETIDTILGNAEGRIPYNIIAGPRGPLKDRVLKIESEKIHDFLENDIEAVMRMQLRTMAPDIELSKKFGSVDLEEELRKVNDEANAKIAAATTEAQRKKIDKDRKAAVRDIEGIRDRLRGTYKLPSDPASMVIRANRTVRNLNYLRLLGGMTVSAIPDMAKVVFTHGLTSTFSDGFLPLVRSFKDFRAAAEEVKLAGTALDMVLDSRTMALADIADDFGRHSMLERGIAAASSKFGVVSLMAPWNAGMKQFSGLVTMTNVLRAAERVAAGKPEKGDIRKLAASGIDADLAERIAKEFQAHGSKSNGVWLAQTGDWADRGAIEAFRAAVVRDVDRTIVTPGQDKPLWMSTELGKTVGQFKSFAVSSMQKTMLSGIQQRDAATLNGTLAMLGLGALTYALKEIGAGREPSDDASVWAVNALDRSGLVGWLMEANNMSEKFTRGKLGLSYITGEQVSRYASRNVAGALAGPTLDAIADIAQVSGSIFAGDTTKSDLRRARQLVPMQNLFYVRQLFDQVEDATGSALGLPDTRR